MPSPSMKGMGVVAAATAAGLSVAKFLNDRRRAGGCQGDWLSDPVPIDELPREVAEALRKVAAEYPAQRDPFDGCLAATTAAYCFADTIFIYPITPTTPLGETADQWAAAGRRNGFGVVPKVQQMQSEAGAAAAVHGTLVTGALSTTFTASQGLLLMIPNMYKIAGELLPCVFHVAARALAGQALSIFGDHSDIMAVRQTGFALLSSHSVQESFDLALVSHIATLLCSTPFVHFFDGMRTSHEIQKIEALTSEHMEKVVELLGDQIDEFRAKSLNPNHPTLRGTAQSADIYFQNVEAANPILAKVPESVRQAMLWVKQLTGRSYDLFQYVGHPKATDVVVVMGSGAQVVEELMDYYGSSKKVGMLKVHLFRPWSISHFLAAMPASVKRICILDRCKEHGVGEPLYTDVCATMQGFANVRIIGGRYGLASKDFTPGMAHAVFENMMASRPKHPFTVGLLDDVTNLSLPYTEMNTVPAGTVQCLLFGFGSDGTVGANKNAIKMISRETELYTQGHMTYDALKAGGITLSHLRFGPKELKCSYEITAGCQYLAVHKKEYLKMFSVESIFGASQEGSIFVLNSPWTDAEQLRQNIKLEFRQLIVQRKLQLFNIDASSVARQAGMGRLINNIMQTVFFHLAHVMEPAQAIALFKKEVEKTYRNKGPEVVQKNIDAIDMALDHLHLIPLPKGWEAPLDGEVVKPIRHRDANTPSEITEVLDPMQLRMGGTLPVSKFSPGGVVNLGMTQWAKRGVAEKIPVVDMDKCTQCNKCATICPHAVIRPFLTSPGELKAAPASFDSRRAQGGNAYAGLNFRIQVSPLDCTGCEVCVTSCPDNALAMKPIAEALQEGHKEAWDFAMTLPSRGKRFDKFSVKGAQFNQPLLEFSGACEGCGETPYAKLLTQLFGDRMIIANATGCSSIWGGPAGWVPYTVDKETGRGPAWGNSLFEDNAEYGLGMMLSVKQRRVHLKQCVENAIKAKVGSAHVQNLLAQWLEKSDDKVMSGVFGDELEKLLKPEGERKALPKALNEVWRLRDLLARPSMWMMGGDGWSNDIGFGGIDHAMALGENINIMVLDTEVYSNTGGQSSKATPLGSVAKFAQKGKRTQKKDLGGLLMTYEGVYVASCAMGADYTQTVKAIQEAEAHDGPSMVICYSPCIEHRAKTGMSQMANDQKAAVDCGYWPLYRYDPARKAMGEAPFQLDSKTVTGNVKDFLRNQNRYAQLERSLPEDAKMLVGELEKHLADRHETMKQKASAVAFKELVDGLKTELLVVYGSETGTAEVVARRFAKYAKQRGCAIRQCTEMNGICDLPSQNSVAVVAFVATCGDGEIPGSAHQFWEAAKTFEPDSLSKHTFSVFALGDRGYAKFCEAGKLFDKKLEECGAKRVLDMGVGDACDEDGWATGYDAWLPEALSALEVPEEVETSSPPEAPFQIEERKGEPSFVPSQLCPPGAVLTRVDENRRLPPSDYERDIRHFVMNNTDVDLPFHLGDAIGLYPQNLPEDADKALKWFGFEADVPLSLRCVDDTASARLVALGTQRTTARQLFTEVLDMFGRPSRSFYKALAKFANVADAAELNEIATGARFKELSEKSTTNFEVFEMFPSAKPSLAHLFGLVPAMKWRLYSIANSADYVPGVVELTVVINQWQSKAGLKTGTSTKYIQQLKVGDRIAATMTNGTFSFPKDDMTPMIMTGLGTGIAPIRSFVQDRMYKKTVLKKDVGPMVVFYGCRHEREEFFYKEEWELFEKAGVLTRMVPAFSHDAPHYPPKMIFVNQRMEENPELLGDLIGKKGGYFYMCGLAVAVPGIDKALKQAMVLGGTVKEEDADAWLEEMKKNGRYSQESY